MKLDKCLVIILSTIMLEGGKKIDLSLLHQGDLLVEKTSYLIRPFEYHEVIRSIRANNYFPVDVPSRSVNVYCPGLVHINCDKRFPNRPEVIKECKEAKRDSRTFASYKGVLWDLESWGHDAGAGILKRLHSPGHKKCHEALVKTEDLSSTLGYECFYENILDLAFSGQVSFSGSLKCLTEKNGDSEINTDSTLKILLLRPLESFCALQKCVAIVNFHGILNLLASGPNNGPACPLLKDCITGNIHNQIMEYIDLYVRSPAMFTRKITHEWLELGGHEDISLKGK